MTVVPPTRPSRRIGAALVAAGLVTAVSAVALGVSASPAGGAELFSFDLRSGARAYTYFNEDAKDAGIGFPGVPVNESRAELQNGPVGYGLSSLGWPGPLASNAGSLILVLNPSAPPQANQANYPVRAEARTGPEPPTTENNTVPGTSMKATATADMVEATTTMGAAAGDPGAFGPTASHALTKTTTSGGEAVSSSELRDVVIGPITFESIVSVASAKTDGTKAEADAQTQVTGMEVGGQPAYFDDEGLKIGEQNQPANAVANQIAQQALEQAGFQIVIGVPTKEVDGATATATAPSIIITHPGGTNPGGGIILGGATAQVTGAPSLDDLLGDVVTDVDGGDLGSTGGTGDLGNTDVGSVVPDTPAPTTDTGSSSSGGVAISPQNTVATGKPIQPIVVILALFGAGLMALGARRLTDEVLAERAAAISCPLVDS